MKLVPAGEMSWNAAEKLFGDIDEYRPYVIGTRSSGTC